MNVTQEDARESLELVEDTTTRLRRAIAASYAGGLLILWGLIWVIGFASVHFLPRRAGHIFTALDLVGLVGTVLLVVRWPQTASVRGTATTVVLRRMCVFWALLFAYALAWIVLTSPLGGLQLCVFLCTVGMFGYTVIGLWSGSLFMLWLGLAVTALTFIGYYALPDHFYLWMSPTGGGALLGTGLYIRIRWR
jgi:hypothetical protein